MRYLYVVIDGSYCKIGHSNNPARRAAEIWYPSHKDGPRRAPIKRIWPLGSKSPAVELAVIRAMEKWSLGKHNREWFKVSWRKLYKAVDASIREVVGERVQSRPFRLEHNLRGQWIRNISAGDDAPWTYTPFQPREA